jgi:YHS domain-containing protein
MRALSTGVVAWAIVGLGLGPGEGTRRGDQEALKTYGPLVGQWRGTGQLQRTSAKGAWREDAQWTWKLSSDSAELELKIQKGKYIKSARLKRGDGPDHFVLDATLADDIARRFSGQAIAGKPLVLTASEAGEGVRRITLTQRHDTRLLLLLEAQDAPGTSYRRLAEVGYTREGVSFAAGESYPACIVTDGRGTIQVTHKGKTYWVCCSGCKDLFNEDPEAIIDEARERQKAASARP